MGMALWLALGLLWQFDRAYTPAPSAFIVSYTTTDGQQVAAMSATPSAVGACVSLGGEATSDTYCTAWPQCPAPGVIVFWVQAVWGEEDSEKTNLLTCLFDAAQPCICLDPVTYVPVPGAPVIVPPLPPGEIPPITTVNVPLPPPFVPAYPPAPT